jgi:hypothetical protein
MHSFSGICGRFYSYLDGGGLITLSGPSYWAPTAFSLTGSLPGITLSWRYQDRNGRRDTPPRGCSGVRIYRSATAFIDTFDTGTLIYSGDGTSCVDDNADSTGSAVLYYTAYTVWEDNSRIVDPRIVMAWTYWGSTVEIPSFFWWPSCGELNDDDGTALVSYTFTNHVDAPTKAEAEEEIDEDDPDVSFSDIAEFSALHTIDLLWVFNGAAKWNDGYTAVYRSLSAGTGLRGTLVARTNHLWGEYTDTVADDYVTRYYTFVHYVYGVGVYTYEKTVAAKTRDLSLTAPATAYSGVAFSTVLQCLHWDGTSDTSYTPTDSLALSITGTSTAISPTSTSASGWANGAKTVSTTLTCVGTGSTTIWATGAGLVASDTLLNKIHTLTVTVPANVESGVAFDVAIQGVGWEGGNDTSYVPAEALTLSIGNANTVSPTSVGVTGWSSGAKTVSVTITGTTYGSDTVSLVNSIGDAGSDTFEYSLVYFYDAFNYSDGELTTVSGGIWEEAKDRFGSTMPSCNIVSGNMVGDVGSADGRNSVAGKAISGEFSATCSGVGYDVNHATYFVGIHAYSGAILVRAGVEFATDPKLTVDITGTSQTVTIPGGHPTPGDLVITYTGGVLTATWLGNTATVTKAASAGTGKFGVYGSSAATKKAFMSAVEFSG